MARVSLSSDLVPTPGKGKTLLELRDPSGLVADDDGTPAKRPRAHITTGTITSVGHLLDNVTEHVGKKKRT